MTSFDARLRIIGDTTIPLGVEVDLTGERMVVTTDGNTLANWSLDDIQILARGNGFLIEAEGEEVILNVSDEARFATEIGLHTRPGR
jgi:hypothetical protein